MTTGIHADDLLNERSSELQPRELIVTIFGLYARAESNWLSVASVVRLMSHLSVDGAAVRSSISRLKRRGTLEAQRHDGAAGYSLSKTTLDALAEGDVRIFDRKRAEVEDGWLMVVFSIPESERDKRHVLRTFLTRLGFGTTAPGVWIAPGSLARETRETLERRGLTEYVDMYSAKHLASATSAQKCGPGGISMHSPFSTPRSSTSIVRSSNDRQRERSPRRTRSLSTCPCSPSGGDYRTSIPASPSLCFHLDGTVSPPAGSSTN